MAAQQSGHHRWEALHAKSFLAYWGHAARYDDNASVPVVLALRIHGSEWLFANSDSARPHYGPEDFAWILHALLGVLKARSGPLRPRFGASLGRIREEGLNAHFSPRCKSGRCPDLNRFLQLAWESYQSGQRITAVTSWIQGAAQRDQWKEFSQDWMLRNGCSLFCYYPCRPEEVDLCGRQLFQNGEFLLLPIRHVPVESAYAVSFQCLDHERESSVSDPITSEHLHRVYSDGSASQHRGQQGSGGAAVVILPPYATIEQAVVSYFKIPAPCTNIEAEVRATNHALYMIETLRRHYPSLDIQFCTDSQYVLQVLEGAFIGTHHASVTNEILCRWSKLCLHVQASHVRAHRGNLLNEIADHFAKAAIKQGHFAKIYRTLEARQARVVPNLDGSFVAWLSQG